LINNIIISDTSCLIALDRINHLEILQKTFVNVYTTAKVQEEFGALLPKWIIIKKIGDHERLIQIEKILDAGEASAILSSGKQKRYPYN
jgi:predicted nucleic acid-binding protein